MDKYISFYLILFFLPLLIIAQEQEEKTEPYLRIEIREGKPKVKAMNSYLYQYDKETLIKSDLVQTSYFDDDGREYSRVFLMGNGKQSRKVNFYFDEAGRMARKIHYDKYNIGTQYYSYIYTKDTLLKAEQVYTLPDSQLVTSKLRKYNRQSMLISEQTFAGDTMMSNRQHVQLLEYNRLGWIVQQDFLDDSGLIYQSFWYDYDEKGQETDFMSLDGEGHLLAQRRTNYLDFGKEELAYLGTEMLSTKVLHTYNILSDEIREEEKSYFRQNVLIEKELYRYDKRGRILLYQKTRMSKAYEFGTYTERVEYIYNSQGFLSETVHYINTELQKRHLYLYEYE